MERWALRFQIRCMVLRLRHLRDAFSQASIQWPWYGPPIQACVQRRVSSYSWALFKRYLGNRVTNATSCTRKTTWLQHANSKQDVLDLQWQAQQPWLRGLNFLKNTQELLTWSRINQSHNKLFIKFAASTNERYFIVKWNPSQAQLWVCPRRNNQGWYNKDKWPTSQIICSRSNEQGWYNKNGWSTPQISINSGS